MNSGAQLIDLSALPVDDDVQLGDRIAHRVVVRQLIVVFTFLRATAPTLHLRRRVRVGEETGESADRCRSPFDCLRLFLDFALGMTRPGYRWQSISRETHRLMTSTVDSSHDRPDVGRCSDD